MTQIVLSANLDASPTEVFDFMSDYEFLSTWCSEIECAEVVGGGMPKVGTVVQEQRRLPALLGGVRTMRTTLTSVEPGHRLSGRVVERGVQVSFAWEFTQLRRDHTRVTLRCAVVPTRTFAGVAARIASTVVRRHESRQLAGMPDGLRAWRRAGRSAS